MIWKRLFGGGEDQNGGGRKVREVHGDRVIEFTQRSNERSQPQSWQPVNALEEQMAEIPNSVEAQFAFARMLLESDALLARSSHPEAEGSRVLDHDENFDIICIDDGSGGTVAAMFTSEERLAEAFGAGAPYVAMNGRAALEAVRHIGVKINPGSGLYVLYRQDVIERILSGNI